MIETHQNNSSETPERHAGGRPSKLPNFLVGMKAFYEGLNLDNLADFSLIALTEEEMLDTINDHVEEEHRIDIRTFQRYKTTGGAKGGIDSLEGYSHELEEFCRLQKRFDTACKRKLQQAMIEDPYGQTKSWQRFAWIMQRKWPDQYADYTKQDINQKHSGEVGVKMEILNFSTPIENEQED